MRIVAGVGLLAAGLGIGLVTGSPATAQVKGPPDFRMDKADSSPGEVTFSHEKHRAKVNKQEGKLCGACHDGKTKMGGGVVFATDECDRCHKD